jgi:YbgC/YbaW family acyl-CoA thioester hydrolase
MIRAGLHIVYWSARGFFAPRRVDGLGESSCYSLFVLPHHLDLNGHVNNAQYFSYCNQARLVHLAKSGILRHVLKKRLRPVITRMEVDFLRELKLFQRFQVRSEISDVKSDQVILKHGIFRKGKAIAEVKCEVRLYQGRRVIDHLALRRELGHG